MNRKVHVACNFVFTKQRTSQGHRQSQTL